MFWDEGILFRSDHEDDDTGQWIRDKPRPVRRAGTCWCVAWGSPRFPPSGPVSVVYLRPADKGPLRRGSWQIIDLLSLSDTVLLTVLSKKSTLSTKNRWMNSSQIRFCTGFLTVVRTRLHLYGTGNSKKYLFYFGPLVTFTPVEVFYTFRDWSTLGHVWRDLGFLVGRRTEFQDDVIFLPSHQGL